jgi:hypothetical protein
MELRQLLQVSISTSASKHMPPLVQTAAAAVNST